MRLSVVSHFYNNASAVEAMLASFRNMSRVSPGAFDFILVDDHSHEAVDPTLFEGIENLRVFRIVEDVAWNMPAARNIGVYEARCEKILLMDIDHVVDPTQVDNLLSDADRLGIGKLGYFKRKKRVNDGLTELASHINSFIIHGSDFLKSGGYEEDFSGHYGHEDKFFRICCRRNGIKEVPLETTLIVKDSATRNLDRDKSFNTVILNRLIEEGATKPTKYMTCQWVPTFPRTD